jgi:hypothetical protein
MGFRKYGFRIDIFIFLLISKGPELQLVLLVKSCPRNQ